VTRSEKKRRGLRLGKQRRERARRARWRPLWTLMGLFGLGVVATFLSSRRIRPMDEWQELLEDEEVPPRRREPFPSTPLEVAGPAGVLHVEDGGSGGLPVLFVHGLGGSCGQWRYQLAHLRRTRRALALDLRGHGRSAPADDVHDGGGEYGIGEFADDVAAVADDLGLARFVLVGHSLGAAVAVEYAGREAERVAGLVLVDPNGDQTEIPRRELADFLTALAAEPRDEMRWYFKQVLVGAAPETAEQVLADLEATPGEALVRALESSFDYSPLPSLEAYRKHGDGPVLSVISDMNTLPYSLHNLVEDLPVRLVTGTSHWLMLDRPDELDAALDAFLARLEAAAASAVT
jgi:pimeloyl-ACP methyl ester carboxylesterase